MGVRTVDRDSVLQRNTDVVYRALAPGKGGVLLHTQTAAYHGINAIGAQIWELIDGSRTADAIAVTMRAQLPDAPERLETDVREFLEGLEARDIIRCG